MVSLNDDASPLDDAYEAQDPGAAQAEQTDEAQAEQANQKPDRLRLVPPSEMDWRGAELNLVKELLGHGMMALLYGESGSAKTLIAVSLALHAAHGLDWCGRKVKRGFVAYLAPEGGHSVHLRYHAWCRHHGFDPYDDSLPFRTIPVRVDLCKSNADLKQIIANVRAAETELGPCLLVVVDTVSRALAGGDENAPGDMGNFVANCDRPREERGATVLGVHHTPKGGAEPARAFVPQEWLRNPDARQESRAQAVPARPGAPEGRRGRRQFAVRTGVCSRGRQ